MVITSAPGKVILFGEHAVLYNKPAISGAISARTTAEFKERLKYNEVIFKSKPDNLKMDRKARCIQFGNFEEFYENAAHVIKTGSNLDSFFNKWYECITILTAKFENDNPGFVFSGYHSIRVINDVPKGCGAGSSIAASVVAAMSKHLKERWDRKEIYNSVCFSDDLLHAGNNSNLDANTVVYGNFQFKRRGGNFEYFRKKESFPILVVDSGVAARTGAQTRKLDDIIKTNDRAMEWIDDIGLIAEDGIRQTKKGNFPGMGDLMYENHELLKKLEMSCPELDKIVEIAKENNAYGAKMTGAGGGGSAIVLAENINQVKENLSLAGFKSKIRHVGVAGIRDESRQHNV